MIHKFKGGEISPSLEQSRFFNLNYERERKRGREEERGGESDLYNYRRRRLMGSLRDKLLQITITE